MRFEEIFSMHDNGGYDWNEVHVFKREDGAFAVDYQAGCSCNSYDPPNEDELEWLHGLDKLYKEFEKVVGEHKYVWSVAEYAEGRNKLSQILTP